ncbi:ABC transporter permease [Xylocopilactobacillus apicola]|uniref:Peptide ABC transporter permease n=1 Tax=Xylocopilactobacillus apicola TaxID=2932184 RepID=A0AAU9DQN1_9LACO|nr:ABC transporter permease [Xylocopilactobacillus apicola]BDR59502.1 peptide ABC transporter permease [Xylocopilactobacillus apicola]
MLLMTVLIAWYANSYTLNYRSQQLRLFSVIGFSKREMSKMFFFEKILCLGLTLLLGTIGSLSFARLGYLVVARMLKITLKRGFGLSLQAFMIADLAVVLIFIFLFFLDLIWIQRHNPLTPAIVDQREPKTRWFMLIFGFWSIILGYYLAVTLKDPIDAIQYFFIAVMLVIVGTYFIFIAGSIFVLKFLRGRRSYYYRPQHFIRIGNLLTRMKQNGAGLASITILITMTLVTVISTVALFLGQNQMITAQSPVDLQYTVGNNQSDPTPIIYAAAQKSGVEIKTHDILKMTPILMDVIGLHHYDVHGVLLADFNRMAKTTEKLTPNEVIIVKEDGYEGSSLKIDNQEFRVKRVFRKFPNVKWQVGHDTIYLIFAMKEKTDETQHFLTLKGSDQKQLALFNNLPDGINVQSKAVTKDNIRIMMNGLLFIGILCGSAFVLITFLILYYKQLSEAFEDVLRYQTLLRVGLAQSEIKKNIVSQLRVLFYLPLATAMIHLLFALPFIQRVLSNWGLKSKLNFMLIGLGVLITFALMYRLMGKLTMKVYYRIIFKRR